MFTVIGICLSSDFLIYHRDILWQSWEEMKWSDHPLRIRRTVWAYFLIGIPLIDFGMYLARFDIFGFNS